MAQKKRQRVKRGSLQKGGVLYAEKARHIVKQCEDAKLQEAQALVKRNNKKKATQREKEWQDHLLAIRKKAKARAAFLKKKKMWQVDLYMQKVFKVVD